jgi:hypothetical protein
MPVPAAIDDASSGGAEPVASEDQRPDLDRSSISHGSLALSGTSQAQGDLGVVPEADHARGVVDGPQHQHADGVRSASSTAVDGALRAVTPLCLLRRAHDCSAGAEDAAVAVSGLQPHAATLALVEVLTRVLGHACCFAHAAGRAGEHRVKNDHAARICTPSMEAASEAVTSCSVHQPRVERPLMPFVRLTQRSRTCRREFDPGQYAKLGSTRPPQQLR